MTVLAIKFSYIIWAKYVCSAYRLGRVLKVRVHVCVESLSSNSRKPLKSDIFYVSPDPKHWQYDTARKQQDMQKPSW